MTTKWPVVPLNEIVEIVRGVGNHTSLPYIGMEDIESNSGRIIGSVEPRTVKSQTFRFDDKHVLYGRLRPYLNKVAVPEFAGHCSTEIFPIRPHENLDRRFLAYWLASPSICQRIDETCTGARMPRANMEKVMGFEFPLPPLNEQKRIVAKLDEAMRLVGEESLSVARQVNELAILRTEILREIFNPKGIGTAEVSLGEVAERVVVGFVGTTSPHYRESGIPFLRTQNVTRKGLRLEELNFITPEFHAASKKSQIKEGDVLLSRVITDSVNVGVVPAELGEANCANVVIVTPGKNLIPEYLAAFIGSPASQQYLLSRKVGSAQVVVNTGTVKEWPIPVPLIAKQKEIISKLQTIELEIDLVERTLELKQAQLSDFTKSFLTSAFAGAL